MSLSLRVGNYDYQVTDNVNSRASYEYNKDRLFPAAIAASTSTDTKFGRLRSGVAVDPQVSALMLYVRVVFGMPRTGSSPFSSLQFVIMFLSSYIHTYPLSPCRCPPMCGADQNKQ